MKRADNSLTQCLKCFHGIEIWSQLVSSHQPLDGLLKGDDEISGNPLVAVDALPDTWLTRIAAASQLSLPSCESNHLVYGSFFVWHE